KSIYRMQDRPYIIGGLCLLAGYLHAAIRRVQKPVSREFIAFLRKEQLTRVKALFKVTGVRYQTQPL
ncbi:MAG: hypothetical protein ACE5I1_11275, partial [bacterium]